MDRHTSRVLAWMPQASALVVLLLIGWGTGHFGERASVVPVPPATKPAPDTTRYARLEDVAATSDRAISTAAPAPNGVPPATALAPRPAAGTDLGRYLRIQVVDANGRPAENAWVEIVHDSRSGAADHVLLRRTDEKGALRLPLDTGTVRVVAWTEEHLGGPELLDLGRNSHEAPLEIRLAPAQSVEGIVVDQETARPIAGATLTFWTFSESDAVQTAADGTFRHPRFPDGGLAQQIRVEAPGYGASVRYLRVNTDGSWRAPAPTDAADALVGRGTPWLELALCPEARIHGRIEDPDREPIESARVVAEGFYRVLPNVAARDGAETHTDEGGDFLLTGLRSDISHAIVVRAPGFAERIVEVAGGRGGDHDLGPIRLEREAVLLGVVVDPEGHPVEDIEVLLVPKSAVADGSVTPTETATLDVEIRVQGAEERARTSTDGTFVFERLTQRPYELLVQRDNEALLTVDVEPAPGTGFPYLELGLPYHTLTMTGTVRGPDGPLSDARIELRRFGTVGAVRADANGRFRIAGLDDLEAYVVSVTATCKRTGEPLSCSANAWGFESPALTASSP